MAGWGYPQPFNDNYTRYRVANMEAAKAYPCGPNASVILWDANKPVFYLKETDAGGFMTNFEAFDFAKKDISEPANADYATKQEIAELAGMIANLTATLQSQQNHEGVDQNVQSIVRPSATGEPDNGSFGLASGGYAGGYANGVRPVKGEPGA